MKPFSNAQVAKLVGIHPITLERWLALGELRWPKIVVSDGQIVRLWKEADVRRLREYKIRTAEKRLAEKCARLPGRVRGYASHDLAPARAKIGKRSRTTAA